ncbi:MAG: TIGR03087 family PEP-CTERM/XrtA system glycosyltransferase [Phycisphaeraceae bacterium]
MISAVDDKPTTASPLTTFGGTVAHMHDDEVAAEKRRLKRVLMLTHRLPYPPDRGDRIRSYHLLKLLSKHFDVALASTSDEPAWLQHHQLLSTMATRVDLQPITKRGSQIRGFMSLLTGQAITPTSFFRLGLADTIRLWHQQKPFDAVLTFCTGMVQYARIVTQPGRRSGGADASAPAPAPVRHVLDLVDVDSQKWAAYAKSSHIPMKWVYAIEARRLRRIEAGEYDRFDAVTVVSQTEADCYRNHVGEHPGLRVVSNGVDMNYFCPQPDPNNHSLVFVGVLDYKPNYEGIAWFVEKVMPKLRKRVPDAVFNIVGRNPTDRVKRLSLNDGVELIGSVPDVRVHLRDASVAIAPLQIARGVQNKVLEAMSSRRAVVASPGASQGVDAVDGEHLLVASEPDQWVDTIEKLFNDADLRARLGAAARARIEERYTWDQQLMPMVKLLSGE